MYRALVRSFVENNKLVTTYSKARVIIPIIEKLITKAKRNSISDRRFVYGFTGNDRIITDKIFVLSKMIISKNGGFLTYINLPARKGDNAPMVRVDLTEKITMKPDKTDGKSKSHKAQEETVAAKVKPSVSSAIKRLSLKRKKQENKL